MKGILTAFLLAGGVLALSLPALAQGRSSDPNLGHFYMARQQIQILDDAPQVFDKRTNPAAAQQGAAAIPRGPAPLPRAGFNAYSSSLPQGMGSSLPEVVNGVPKKLPQAPASVAPRSAKAGAYKTKKAAAPKPKGPVTAKTYAPYNGYGGAPAVSTAPGAGYYGSGSGVSGSSRSSSSNVKGSLLHWSRTRQPGSY